MIQMTFVLNRELLTELRSNFGHFTAFTGNGSARNDPDSAALPDEGPIPPGKYYVVDRPTGGMLGPIRDAVRREKNEWFALYREDGLIDDQTFWHGVMRGAFRLHPRGPLGVSKGCITLQYADQFRTLRERLLRAGKAISVPRTGHRAYATVDVMALGPNPDTLEPAAPRGRRLA